MAKPHIVYICSNCGKKSAHYFEYCPECKQQGAMEKVIKNGDGTKEVKQNRRIDGIPLSEPQKLSDIETDTESRWQFGIGELDRVLGGGLVPGSVILLGGDPGIGKSTIVLGAAAAFSNRIGTVLYTSGEESAHQLKMRADRLGIDSDNLYMLTETNLERIIQYVKEINPDLLIVDSIQTVYSEEIESSPGGVTQVRECASKLQVLAKTTGIAIILIGHVTKDGSVAGPRILEHLVDAVLYLEGDPFQAFRLLRGIKNRFGATNEVGVFEMVQSGLLEVNNPSEAFLGEGFAQQTGAITTIALEGTRPLLVNVQALTTTSAFSSPRRTANGVDTNRLLLVSAVLSKHVKVDLATQDIFINVVGGFKISEPSADLAMALALASSYKDIPIQARFAAIGEVGLGGELIMPAQTELRLREAASLAFTHVVLPKLRRKIEIPAGLNLYQVTTLAEAVDKILKR